MKRRNSAVCVICITVEYLLFFLLTCTGRNRKELYDPVAPAFPNKIRVNWGLSANKNVDTWGNLWGLQRGTFKVITP
jgi:hypothetical protein